ncbi:hypothetical protein [Pararhizobium capsulatum]|uniref:hypothetical protein n=1 Tax=Pararhizobium capsulatum TaxID=34014 RepID=UPI003522595A
MRKSHSIAPPKRLLRWKKATPRAATSSGFDADSNHDHYDEPVDVRWLCHCHHTRLHDYGGDMFPVRTA